MIYDNIRRLADERGISLTDVEAKAGIANGLIGKWRETVPRVDSLQAVAKVLDVTVNDLIDEQTQKTQED